VDFSVWDDGDDDGAVLDELHWRRIHRGIEASARADLRARCDDAFKRGMAARERWIARELAEAQAAERERIARKVVPVDFQRGTSSSAIPCKE
jgi:hypothetical protein